MALPSLQARSPLSAVPAARDHFVQFYEHDDTLVEEVARYLRHGLESGCAAIAITTQEHLRSIHAVWRRQGFDAKAAEARGQLVTLDAATTLARLMCNGAPDPARFEQVVGSLIRNSAALHGDVMAFGEMVALLVGEGRQTAAAQLEDLWNQLGQVHRFSLFCAYPMSHFATEQSSDAFRHICGAHAHLLPTEGFSRRTESEQVRMVVDLQQKAASLAHELGLRRATEARLAESERELADFVGNAVVGLHRVGPDGTILWANEAELRMLGYEAHEYIGRNIAEFHADGELLGRILETLKRGGALHEHAATMRCKDGSLRRVLVSSNALIRDGNLVHTRCFTHDVTDRWLAQEALRERTAILHLALQGGRAGYWVGELDSGRMRCSSELASLLGLDGPFEGSWSEFEAMMHPADQPVFRTAVDESIASRGRLNATLRLGEESAWRRYEVRGEPAFDDAGRAVRFYGICLESR
jgi:PAS domain S-box-containing protein